MKTDYLAWIIKVAAIVTAAPRWIGALLAAEGFALPADWLPWWIPVSAGLSAGMAIVEGLAFAYVFEAWRNQQERDGNDLLYFALFSALVFVMVLAPYIAAAVTGQTLALVLAYPLALYAWSACVGLSTIAIVASVGYAQKRKGSRSGERKAALTFPQNAQVEVIPPLAAPHVCAVCMREFRNQQALAAHMRVHANHKDALPEGRIA